MQEEVEETKVPILEEEAIDPDVQWDLQDWRRLLMVLMTLTLSEVDVVMDCYSGVSYFLAGQILAGILILTFVFYPFVSAMSVILITSVRATMRR